ncbi:hypothetical protein BDZ89DRAFT_1056799 [Hymenopellis radicata]|nr:hypothetical protein BDZ89DRAFT_1056799 [Hymenopellis radicata]
MDSFDALSRSTAPSSPPTSPPTSMGSILEDDDVGPYSKFQNIRSTDATIDDGSVESLSQR